MSIPVAPPLNVPPPPTPSNHPPPPPVSHVVPHPPNPVHNPSNSIGNNQIKLSNDLSSSTHPSFHSETLINNNQSNNSNNSHQQMDSLKFEVDLWDKFEEVFLRVTRGRHDLKKIKGYMEERSEAEKAYGRALKKAHEVGELEEGGSLTLCWKDLMTSGPNLSKQHEQFGVMCGEVAAILEKCIVDLKNTKTKLSLNFKKLSSERANRKQSHDRARQAYSESIKVAENAVIQRDQAKAQNLPPKQLEKLDTNMKQKLKENDSLHTAYKKSVEALVESQKAMDAGIIEIMQQFEKLERTRLKTLSDQLDRFAQSHEFLKSSLDQIAVFLHRGISGINISKDIQDYITKNRSGAAHPPYAQYEPIPSSILDGSTKDSFPSSSPIPSAPSAPSAPVPAIPFPPLPVSNPPGLPSSKAPSPFTAPLPASSNNSAHNVNVAVALFDFDSTEADDLSFKAGDIINLSSSPAGDDWWQGELNGRSGMFPKNYVSKADSSGNFVGADGSVIGNVESLGVGQTKSSNSNNQLNPPGSSSSDSDAPKLINATCIALYDFEGQDTDELSFKAGEKLVITGELNGWYLGREERGTKVGIFPSNYVNINEKL